MTYSNQYKHPASKNDGQSKWARVKPEEHRCRVISRLSSRSLLAAFTLCGSFLSMAAAADKAPNIVLIVASEQGFGDLGCFGSKNIQTPNIDRIASEGRRFTSFISAASLSTHSRAALLTGCYPRRIDMHKFSGFVLRPGSKIGLNPSELTIAEHLKAKEYDTSYIGVWHLGEHPETLPRQQGFDSYFGLPYPFGFGYPNNKDMPKAPKHTFESMWKDQEGTAMLWKTALMENEKIVELPTDPRSLGRRFTDRAVKFIKTKREKPFFLCLAHSMPHTALYVPKDVYDPDPKNAYKCVTEHLDAEVGRVMSAIRDAGLSENTYVIYTSISGPQVKYKNFGGSSAPFRAGMGTSFEGGMRVPFIIWAPGRIPAGTVCNELASSIDLLPTIAGLAKSQLPGGLKIDGLDLAPLLIEKPMKSPRTEMMYYSIYGAIDGIRQGKWKLLAAPPKRGKDKTPKRIELYDLTSDLAEKNNLAEKHPNLVAKLRARMAELGKEIETNSRSAWVKKDAPKAK